MDLHSRKEVSMSAIRVGTALFVASLLCAGRLAAADHADPTWEAWQGNVALIKALLDKNPALVHEELSGLKESGTLLHYSIGGGHRELVALLLERGANIEAKSSMGTPLQIAARRPHEDIAEFLLQKGAHLDVHSAAGLGKAQQVKEMLRANPKLARSTDAPYQRTPLHWAACIQNVEVARILLDHGVDPSAPDVAKWTPLRMAVLCNRVKMVKLLLARGAKVDSYDDCGETPLCLAVILRHRKVAEILLDAGADVNARKGHNILAITEPSRGTLLHIAAGYGDVEMMALLVRYKADVKATDRSGETPLDWWRSSEANPATKARQLLDGAEDLVFSTPRRARQRLAEILRRANFNTPGH
jgi:ankyrin repeat protein